MMRILQSRWSRLASLLTMVATAVLVHTSVAHATNLVMLSDAANPGYCLAADLTGAALEKCDSSNPHQVFDNKVSLNYNMFGSQEVTSACLAADLTTAKLVTCKSSNGHMKYFLGQRSNLGGDLFSSYAGNSVCLAADLSVVKLEPCDTNDGHQSWTLETP